MYTSSYTLYASRGSKCAPSCFDLPGLLNIESYGFVTHTDGIMTMTMTNNLFHKTYKCNRIE